MSPRVPPEARPILAALRGRSRCTFSYTARRMQITTSKLKALLAVPLVVTTLARSGWSITDSQALRLPPLLDGLPVPMLVRTTDDSM